MMKRFKQHLEERELPSFYDFFKSFGELVEVHKNPVKGDFLVLLRESKDGLRGIITDNDLYVWDGYKAAHFNAADGVDEIEGNAWTGDWVGIWLDKDFVSMSDSTQDLLEGGLIDSKMLYRHPRLEAIYGRGYTVLTFDEMIANG